MPIFGPAHPKASKVDTEIPTASSLTDATASFHEAYYVKVNSPRSSLALLAPFSLHG